MLEVDMKVLNFSPKWMLFVFLSVVQPSNGKENPGIHLTNLNPSQLPPSVTITIDKDPVYQTRKTYEAYPLNEVLKKVPVPSGLETEDAIIVFTAFDGYEVTIPYSNTKKEQGFIAFRDLAAPANEKWIEFQFGKTRTTPAPFYLVWPKKGLDKWKYPWPFQLVNISIRPALESFGAAVPSSNNNQVKKGFVLFSQYCIRCHSMNLSGGTVGPELNVPKNITEYFKEEALPGFILDAPSYRSGTKMPAFDGIIDKNEMKNLLEYLRYMKTEKINVR